MGFRLQRKDRLGCMNMTKPTRLAEMTPDRAWKAITAQQDF